MPASVPWTTSTSGRKGDEAIYPFSPTVAECDRLEGQHAAIVELMGIVTHANVSPNPTLLIDLGCGTGCVTTYLGATYPTATTIGVDHAPISPDRARRLNVEFIQGDIQRLNPTLHPSLAAGTADLAFGRLLALGITDWPGLVTTTASLVKPGGHVELQELLWRVYDSDGIRIDDSMEWMVALRAGMLHKGLDPDAALKMQQRMEDVGLVDVRCWTYKWTVGPWLANEEPRTRRMGKFNGVEMVGPLSEILEGTMDDESRRLRLQQEMREDLRARGAGEQGGVFWEFKVTMGRKAEDRAKRRKH
ncbi:MAG: hypothetical protein Q9160_001377 [Pyrenula sp. 1 TL-2023]